MSVPSRDQVLHTRDSFHRVCFGVVGRDLETHSLDQVVVERDERWFVILVINDCSHASEIFEIPGMRNLFARGRNRDGLFQDGIKGRIARNDGILEIADDKTVCGEESF